MHYTSSLLASLIRSKMLYNKNWNLGTFSVTRNDNHVFEILYWCINNYISSICIGQKWSHSTVIRCVFCYNTSWYPSLRIWHRERRRISRVLGAYLDVRAQRVYFKIRNRSSGSVLYHRHVSEWVMRSVDLGILFLVFFSLLVFFFIYSPFKIMKSVHIDYVL